VATYRFYFLDEANHIYEAAERDFEDDAQAIESGLQEHHGGVYAVEIWRANRLVHRQKVTESSDSSRSDERA